MLSDTRGTVRGSTPRPDPVTRPPGGAQYYRGRIGTLDPQHKDPNGVPSWYRVKGKLTYVRSPTPIREMPGTFRYRAPLPIYGYLVPAGTGHPTLYADTR